MNEPVRIKSCETLKVLLSEIPNMILPKSREITNPEQVTEILKALSEDILFMRKDREVEIEFFFSVKRFHVTIDYGYVHLRKNSELEFYYEYDYNVSENMNRVLSDAIDYAMEDQHAHFTEIDIEKSRKYFKHIDILDQSLNMGGSLSTYARTTVYRNNVYEQKDVFGAFEVIKACNSGSVSLTLKHDNFKVIAYYEEIIFNYDGVELKFRPSQMKEDSVVFTIKKLIGTFL